MVGGLQDQLPDGLRFLGGIAEKEEICKYVDWELRVSCSPMSSIFSEVKKARLVAKSVGGGGWRGERGSLKSLLWRTGES